MFIADVLKVARDSTTYHHTNIGQDTHPEVVINNVGSRRIT